MGTATTTMSVNNQPAPGDLQFDSQNFEETTQHLRTRLERLEQENELLRARVARLEHENELLLWLLECRDYEL